MPGSAAGGRVVSFLKHHEEATFLASDLLLWLFTAWISRGVAPYKTTLKKSKPYVRQQRRSAARGTNLLRVLDKETARPFGSSICYPRIVIVLDQHAAFDSFIHPHTVEGQTTHALLYSPQLCYFCTACCCHILSAATLRPRSKTAAPIAC